MTRLHGGITMLNDQGSNSAISNASKIPSRKIEQYQLIMDKYMWKQRSIIHFIRVLDSSDVVSSMFLNLINLSMCS